MISWYPVIEVLNTSSPTSKISFPKPFPWNTLPSSNAKIALNGIKDYRKIEKNKEKVRESI